MSTLEAIKNAIAKLPQDERASLESWLYLQSMDEWDKEMERDFSPGGRGEWLMKRVDAQIEAGEVESLGEGLARRRPHS